MNMMGGNETGPHRGDAGPSEAQNSESGSWRKYLNSPEDKEGNSGLESSTGHNQPTEASSVQNGGMEQAGPSQTAPSDCWTGQPDERLLRAMDKKLTQIAAETKALAEKTVEKGALFGIGLAGSPEEQRRSISLILENHLDDLDVDRRLRQIRKWDKDSEVGSPDSSFWLMVVQEIV